MHWTSYLGPVMGTSAMPWCESAGSSSLAVLVESLGIRRELTAE